MFNASFNTSYTDKNGVEVATGYANLNDTVSVNLAVKDRVGYEADRDNLDKQEADFRAKVMQVADIMGIATVTPKEAE
ncbi:hypothetical protein FE414_07080 [Leuconostoc carnosum]|uniref:hypothetical protein n=1 Tax=Leuconostoc carnosum TaxID=1252 RepID=UPI0012385D1F|nr:hypothetical protein [Leuconostoc carnosum]KAA8369792.1 hypothetical protein FE414_07080 [Leuconostoc carnosum]